MVHFSLDELKAAFPDYVFGEEHPSQGGQKSVYFASLNDEHIALKVLNDPLPDESDEDALHGHYPERLRREVEALRSVNSPYLTRILSGPDERIIGGANYLWYTEPRYGKDLHQRIVSEGPLSISGVVNLIHALLQAELVLYENGLVHRDIKPLNVLEKPGCESFVLIDLGVALHLDLSRLTQVTPTRTTIFAAPEQFDSNPIVDHRTDIFQIGLSSYFAATGIHPFICPFAQVPGSVGEYVQRIEAGPDMEELAKVGMPPSLASFIGKCMGSRPNRRYRTVAMAIDAFDGACE